mgnify:FL=1
MSDYKIKPYAYPVTTGTPRVGVQPSVSKPAAAAETLSFQEILKQGLAHKNSLAFSKHAVNRAAERNISLSEGNLERLHEGVRLAGQKGLKEPLILVDKTAFIVSVTNNTVITTVEENELKGSVFTNIDGTVIV